MRIFFLLLIGLFVKASAQEMSSLKTGVVRIQNSRSGEVGAGIILKVDGQQVYMFTVSH
jgi:hypothetical protein